jgi:rhodanese-related sulfurtransferase
MKHSPGFLAIVQSAKNEIREISAEEVLERQKRRERFFLIDVREDHEWAKGRIKGARHLGRGILERDIETTVREKDVPVVLYCGGGYRSALSALNMQKMGYSNVFSMKGGWRRWKALRFPRAVPKRKRSS